MSYAREETVGDKQSLHLMRKEVEVTGINLSLKSCCCHNLVLHFFDPM
jgi:hypothetical protein